MTWFELQEFARGKQERDWELAAYIAAYVHNAHCSKRSSLKSPRQLNPLELAKLRAAQMDGTAKESFDAFVSRNFGRA